MKVVEIPAYKCSRRIVWEGRVIGKLLTGRVHPAGTNGVDANIALQSQGVDGCTVDPVSCWSGGKRGVGKRTYRPIS